MKCYLFIDFGSTYTKLTLVDIEKEEIVSTAKAYTTVETDVMIGYTNALNDLYKGIDKENIEIVKTSACSSAAGGLKIVAIGLVPELTAEAARRAALGAGARIIKTYSFNLNRAEVEEIAASPADMILLAGGTDGGNAECILHNAKMLTEVGIKIPVVVAGNKSANDEIIKTFGEAVEYYITENVMPKLNQINVDPAREMIRDIFMQRIVNARGMQRVESEISGIAMPTPAAVLKAAEVLSQGTKDEEGIGELVVVDIGGATTDIHSIAVGDPTKPGVMMRGLEEPLCKRTVEGDMGMRYSAVAVFEAVGLRHLRKYLDVTKYDVDAEFQKRFTNTSFVSTSAEDVAFDEAIAKICADVSMYRHTGKVEAVYSPVGTIFNQLGKDLSELPYIIGTGGILVNSSNPLEILKAVEFDINEPNSLKPRHPKYLVDKRYILSSFGLLSTIDANMALRMLKKYVVND